MSEFAKTLLGLDRHTSCIDNRHTSDIFSSVTLDWDEERNELLKRTRGISFEQIVVAIEDGSIADVLEHPNPERYPNQRVYLVVHQDYVFAVPFVTDVPNNRIVLKTIYPGRKYTRQYLRQETDHDR
jgi:uncharacterized DUF497 family protein